MRHGALLGFVVVSASLAACALIGKLGTVDVAKGDAGTDAALLADVDATLDGAASVDAPIGPSVVCLPISNTGVCTDGGATLSLDNDPANCGRCGHDCAGGSCTNGVCTRSLVYYEPNEGGAEGGQAIPNGGGDIIGARQGSLYWVYPYADSMTHAIRRLILPPDGGVNPPPGPDGGSWPNPPTEIWTFSSRQGLVDHAVDDSGIYFVVTESGNLMVYRIPLDGDGGATQLSATIQSAESASLALSDSYVYIADNLGEVVAISKDGGTAPPPITGLSFSTDVASAGNQILGWLDQPGEANSTLSAFDFQDNGVFTPPIAAPSGAWLVADQQSFYWLNTASGSVETLSVPAEGGPQPPEAIGGSLDAGELGVSANDAGSPLIALAQGLLPQSGGGVVGGATAAIDGRFVILAFCPGTDPPRLLYDTSAVPVESRIADDEAFIYWAEYGGGVYRLAK